MRYLSIDLGDKRTGLAVGDDETKLATPVGVVEVPMARRDELLERLCAQAAEQDASELVIGIPFNMDGSAGHRAKLVLAFAKELREQSGLVVHEQDERRSSLDADERMAQSGLTHKQKKSRRDALAAAAILRWFLEEQTAAAADEPEADSDVHDRMYPPEYDDEYLWE